MADPDLEKLPVLRCWPADGGRFITLPAVHTVDPGTGISNTGMYRMQLFPGRMSGMHWHRHKTGAAHFEKYKSLGRKMPVTVTLGGDPSYIYAATAPMPENMDEYLLAGFLRKKRVRLVQCLTNDLWVPEDVDFVIEGFVDPSEDLIWEGPFGDHTGFYSLADYYPRFHITAITHARDAVYPATIVGVPPMEDAWIGKATERIFTTPIRLTMIPELEDMALPFAGVAHNLSVVKIRKSYPGQPIKVMNSLWGAGQMMFNKIVVIVDSGIDIHDNEVLADLFFRRFDPARSLHFSAGPLDILDHSSRVFACGSKLGIDLTAPLPEEEQLTGDAQSEAVAVEAAFSGESPTLGGGASDFQEITGDSVLERFMQIKGVSRVATIPFKSMGRADGGDQGEPVFPLLLFTVKKEGDFSRKELAEAFCAVSGAASFKAVVLFDEGTPLDDLFTLVWLTGGNLDPERDMELVEPSPGIKSVIVDATVKTPEHDQFRREWPNIVTMDDATIKAVDDRWATLGLGDLLPSPSLKLRHLVRGTGAVREA